MERDIDMRQTVEEAAREYRDFMVKENRGDQYDFVSGDIKDAFVSGAEWQAKQSPWVSVKERFPEDYEPKIILLKDGQIRVAHFDSGDRDFGVDYFWYDKEADESFDFKDVVAYMNIPSFDEILESNKDVLRRMKENGD